jgi:Lyzozyme M1 (1,4-beta-N-acetylmuramidase)
MLKGIDVSHHQGVIDWDRVKKSGIQFAILSVGYGDDITSQDDKQFHRNAKECTRLGIPFGVYIYSYAMNLSQAKSEAEHVLRVIRGYKLSYPVYYDLEDASQNNLSNDTLAQFAESFFNIIVAQGYKVGTYANLYWFNNKLTGAVFNKYEKWVAQYNTACDYKLPYAIWQYSSSGKVDGIAGNVDVNYDYANRQATSPKPSSPDTSTSQGIWDNSVKGKLGVVTGTNVNGRLSAWGQVIATVNVGDTLKLYRRENEWYHCYSIVDGYGATYIHKDFIEVLEIQGKAKCTADVLNVRTGAGTNYSQQGILNMNEVVDIVGTANGWYRVKYYNADHRKIMVGWASSQYLSRQ